MANPHDEIEALCEERLAIGVLYAHLNVLFSNIVKALAGKPYALPIASTRLAVQGVRTDEKAPTVDKAKKRFVFSNVEFDLKLLPKADPSQLLTTLHFTYPTLTASVEVRLSGKIALKLEESSDPVISHGAPAPDLIEKYFNDEVEQYKREEFFAQFGAIDALPCALLGNLVLPDLLSVSRAIRLGLPLEVLYADEYLLLTTDRATVAPGHPDCPKGADAVGEVKPGVKIEALSDEAATKAGAIGGRTVIVHEPILPELPAEWEGFSPIVLFAPKKTLFTLGFDTLKPSVTAKDGGTFIAYWEYSLTVALRELSVDVELTPGRVQLVIKSKHDIIGAAGAGIEIGCIKFEVAGVKIDGHIDPLDIALFPYIDAKTQRINLATRLTKPAGVDIRIYGGFPLGLVLDLLLSSAIEKGAMRKVSDALNSFRVMLLDLSGLKLPDLSNYRAMVSNKPTSSLMGLKVVSVPPNASSILPGESSS